MVQLLCVDNRLIKHVDSGIVSNGSGLVEGEVYTAEETIHIHPNNKKSCYYIAELQELKLMVRFVLLNEIQETEKALTRVLEYS